MSVFAYVICKCLVSVNVAPINYCFRLRLLVVHTILFSACIMLQCCLCRLTDDGTDMVKDVPDKGSDAPETKKKADCVLPPRLHVRAHGFDACSQAVALLRMTQPSYFAYICANVCWR